MSFDNFKHGYQQGKFFKRTEDSMKGAVGWFFEVALRLIRAVMLAALILYLVEFSKGNISSITAMILGMALEFGFMSFEFEYYADSSIEMKTKALGYAIADISFHAVKVVCVICMAWAANHFFK